MTPLGIETTLLAIRLKIENILSLVYLPLHCTYLKLLKNYNTSIVIYAYYNYT